MRPRSLWHDIALQYMAAHYYAGNIAKNAVQCYAAWAAECEISNKWDHVVFTIFGINECIACENYTHAKELDEKVIEILENLYQDATAKTATQLAKRASVEQRLVRAAWEAAKSEAERMLKQYREMIAEEEKED